MAEDPRAALLSSLADELLHNYPHGRVALAVDALPGTGGGAFADGVADALRARGYEVARVSLADAGEVAGFRHDGIRSFRGDPGLPADAVLLADGFGLLAPGVADIWNLTVWLTVGADPDPADDAARRYLGEVDPPRRADVIVDVADATNPVRRFSDWCVVPRRPR